MQRKIPYVDVVCPRLHTIYEVQESSSINLENPPKRQPVKKNGSFVKAILDMPDVSASNLSASNLSFSNLSSLPEAPYRRQVCLTERQINQREGIITETHKKVQTSLNRVHIDGVVESGTEKSRCIPKNQRCCIIF